MDTLTQCRDALKKYWGYDTYKPCQQEVIASVLNGNDTLAVLPTGAGKSLCYQLPTMVRSGVCLVVEPLISLIKDQIDNLKKIGINAVTVNSLQSSDKNLAALNQIYNYRAKFLFVAAERLQDSSFHYHLREMKISLAVIDEAHCISQWGHSFRLSYNRLNIIKELLPDVPILALTATATTHVREDIIRTLAMKNPQIIVGSFYRDNIFLQTHEVSNKIAEIVQIINQSNGASGIIYCLRRSDSELLALKLKETYGISAAPYHAQLTNYERERTQNDWIGGKIKVIVATTAFGMGINKPDVRFVIHYDIPASLESFYQEFGRAGRDNKPSNSYVLYTQRDLMLQKRISEYSYPNKEIVIGIYNKLCSHYGISFQSGKGAKFPFDFNEFVLRSANADIIVRSALKILKNEGWVDFGRDENPQSSVKILVNNEDLNRFVQDYDCYWYIFELLLRRYPSVHHDEVYINEKRFAQAGFTTEGQVVKDLKAIAAKNIISYSPKITGNYVVFLKDRPFDTSHLLTKEFYYEPQKSVLQKAKQMRDWVLTDKCRWKAVLNYFSEKSSSCKEHCDNCKG